MCVQVSACGSKMAMDKFLKDAYLCFAVDDLTGLESSGGQGTSAKSLKVVWLSKLPASWLTSGSDTERELVSDLRFLFL